jgi:N-acetylglucosamine-6-phosphate deacetylase
MQTDRMNVFMPDGAFRPARVKYGERIEEVHICDNCSSEELPYLIPGLVDIHSHGAMNCDHSDGDAEGMRTMSDYYAQNGVTSYLATTMTLGKDTLRKAMDTVRTYNRGKSARCLGVNMEGPFLSHAKRGAHMAELLREPDIRLFEQLFQASGESIRLVSVAPELPGAMTFIAEASKLCRVALAHTAADYDTAMQAFACGATQVTHLFNAMNPFLHRAPGIVGAAMDAGAYAELIVDGIHLHPSAVRAAYKMFGERICLISDSIRSAGLPDGIYEAGGMPITVNEGKATLKDGTIAGSNISLMEGVRRAVQFGVPPEKALYASTAASAKAIGMEGKVGCIAPGAYADMAVLDRNLNIQKIWIGGEEFRS